MRKTLNELLTDLAESENAVTDWALRECIVARLRVKDFS